MIKKIYLSIFMHVCLLLFAYSILIPGLAECETGIEFSRCPACPEDQEMSKNFALFNEKDELVRFTELIRENNILIAFWASYCAPCKKELPQLVEIEKRYSRSHNIRLVLINVDGEGKEKGLPVLKALNVSSLCLFDIYQVTLKAYKPDLKIPSVFLINRKGKIVFKTSGESEENIKNIERAIQKMKKQ